MAGLAHWLAKLTGLPPKQRRLNLTKNRYGETVYTAYAQDS